MLSFAALSETAIAESTTTLDASAFMSGAAATTTAGTIDTIHLTANPVIPAATGATTAGTLQANITENLDSVSAATASGTVTTDAQASITLPAVTSTTATTAFDDVDAQASITPSAATSTSTAGTIDTIHLTANISITGVALGITPSSPSPNVDEDLVSVSATAAVQQITGNTFIYNLGLAQTPPVYYGLTQAKANITLDSATATSTAGVAGFDAKANITLDAATADADLTVNDLEDEDAQASTTLAGVSAATTANWDTVNGIYAVQVVYLNTDFERTRTVNVVPYGNYKVYVTR